MEVIFYRQHGSTFTDVTSEVLAVSLDDVLPSHSSSLPKCEHYDVELPRKGTTLVVRAPLRAGCFPMGADPTEAQAWSSSVDDAAKRFSWDKKTARFVEKTP